MYCRRDQLVLAVALRKAGLTAKFAIGIDELFQALTESDEEPPQ
jgi:hypothetical protein